MTYDKIVAYFETPEGLIDLINDYKTIFAMIDDIWNNPDGPPGGPPWPGGPA